jgi:D-sedoheptulose 7-phosphate isomerase
MIGDGAMSGFDCTDFWSREFAEHAAIAANTRDSLHDEFAKLVDVCVEALSSGGKLLFFGNGGSASDAQHLATELTVRYKNNRRALAAIALTTDTSALTAIVNDLGAERMFSRQIEALGKPGDVAIGITTSGKSPNILEGLRVARDMGLVAAAFGGKGGGELVGLADPVLVIPSDTTARIQEMHIMLGQMLCNAIEYRLGVAA